jgi:hypothetical protein
MTDFERLNQDAIDALNQRGGRMLSLVDLLDAGTVNLDMAAEMAYVAAHGGSFLTAAGPGGVGKTTLMGAVLGFLPPGVEIVTIEGPAALRGLQRSTPTRPQCLVVHEIGSGPYYGYLWGTAVGRYFEIAMAPGRSLASNLHAETYEQAIGKLTERTLRVSRQALGAVDFFAFMAARGGRRRVTAVWEADSDAATGHTEAWRWRAEDDVFEPVSPAAAAETIARRLDQTVETAEVDLARLRAFLTHAQADGIRRMEDLRQRAVANLFGS